MAEDRPLRVVAAPNAMKGSLDALRVAEAMAEGLARALPTVSVLQRPVADGGDSTVEVALRGAGGTRLEATVQDPLGRPVTAAWGLLPDGKTAVIAMAAASGYSLVGPSERDPLRTSSYGTGQLVRAALDRGCRRVILGIGGSATVDGGAGLLQALGARLRDADGHEIGPGGGPLAQLERIDLDLLDPRLAHTELIAACDVENPLLGPQGAAPVFGPQKGATPEMVVQLAESLGRLARIIAQTTGREVASVPHGGAAGGLGAMLYACLGASLRSGIDVVLDLVGFDDALLQCDLVLTAEGRLDRQTEGGKAPLGVARRARAHGVPVMIFVGEAEALEGPGLFDTVVPICDRPMSMQTALEEAFPLVVGAAERIGRILELGRRLPASHNLH